MPPVRALVVRHCVAGVVVLVGVRVTGTPKHSAVITKVAELIEFARTQGYRRNELVELIEGMP